MKPSETSNSTYDLLRLDPAAVAGSRAGSRSSCSIIARLLLAPDHVTSRSLRKLTHFSTSARFWPRGCPGIRKLHVTASAQVCSIRRPTVSVASRNSTYSTSPDSVRKCTQNARWWEGGTSSRTSSAALMQLFAALAQCETGSTVLRSSIDWEVLPINDLSHVSSQAFVAAGGQMVEQYRYKLSSEPAWTMNMITHMIRFGPLSCVFALKRISSGSPASQSLRALSRDRTVRRYRLAFAGLVVSRIFDGEYSCCILPPIRQRRENAMKPVIGVDPRGS